MIGIKCFAISFVVIIWISQGFTISCQCESLAINIVKNHQAMLSDGPWSSCFRLASAYQTLNLVTNADDALRMLGAIDLEF